MTITKQIEAIEEKLQKKFSTTWVKSHDSMIGLNPCYVKGNKAWIVNPEELKSFYRQEITNLLTTLRAEVWGLRKITDENRIIDFAALEDYGYDKCVDEVLSIIDGKGEE